MKNYRHAIVKRFGPDALNAPLLKQLVENQERIANDPVLQERRQESRRETRRDLLPWLIGGTVLQWAACGALHVYMPGLVEAKDAAILAIMATALSICLFMPILKATD